MTAQKKFKPSRFSPALVVALCLTVGGCNPGGNSNRQTAAATPVQSEYERDLAYVRRARLAHTYVISRKDGTALDADDRQFIARNTPAETTHRLITDGNRRAIIGTNFELYEENKKALEPRFAVEDLPNQ